MGVLRAAAIVACSAFASNVMAQTLFVAPMHVYRTVAAGNSIEETIRLTSDTDVKLHATISVEPFIIGTDGRPQHDQRVKRDLGRWLTVDRAEGDVQSSRELQLKVRIALPPSAAGTYWTAVMIDSVSRVGPPGAEVIVKRRIAIPIVITAPANEAALCHLMDVSAVEVDGKLIMTATLENVGNVAVRAPVAFAVMRFEAGSADEELASAFTAPFLLLPGSKRTVRAQVVRPAGDGAEAWAYFRYGTAVDAVTSLRGLIAPGVRGSESRPVRN